jgi:hypothetical protein
VKTGSAETPQRGLRQLAAPRGIAPRRRRLLVAETPVRDLLLRAKHLFVAAIIRDDRASRYLLLINNSTRDVPGAVYSARGGLFWYAPGPGFPTEIGL